MAEREGEEAVGELEQDGAEGGCNTADLSHIRWLMARGIAPKVVKCLTRVQAAYRARRVRRVMAAVNLSYQSHYNHNVLEIIRHQEKFINQMQLDLSDLEAKLAVEFERKPKRGSFIFGSPSTHRNRDSHAADVADTKTVLAGVKAVVEVHTMIYNIVLSHYDSCWPLLQRVGSVLLSQIPLLVVYNPLVLTFQRVSYDPTVGLQRFLSTKAWSGNSLSDLMKICFKHVHELTSPLGWLAQVAISAKLDVLDLMDIARSYAIVVQLDNFISESSVTSWFSSKKIRDAESQLIDFPSKISFDFCPHRTYVREGPLSIASEPRHVFLFSDIAVVAKRTKRTAYKFEYHIPLTSLEHPTDNEANGFLLRNAERAYQVMAESPEEKISWFIAFQQIANTWRTGSFAIPLDMLIARDTQTRPGVPNILTRLCGYLTSFSNVATDVEICTNGDPYAVEAMRLAIDRRSIADLSLLDYSGATIIGVLKLWLLQLPSPLIPLEVTFRFNLFKDGDYVVADLSQFRRMMRSLPLQNLPVLLRLLTFLEETGVDTGLLGITWGWFFIRPEKKTIDEALQIRRSSNILTAMLNNMESLFKKPPTKEKKEQKKMPPSLLQRGTSQAGMNQPVVLRKGVQRSQKIGRPRSISLTEEDSLQMSLPDLSLPAFSKPPQPKPRLTKSASRMEPPREAPKVKSRLTDSAAVIVRKRKKKKADPRLRRSRSLVLSQETMQEMGLMLPPRSRPPSSKLMAQVTGDSDEEY